ncbi:hypothetical protein KUV22_01735 [Microbulbifer agarilyticus]|uniref:DUF3303 family protein n=1 Tax=Microbulbifer agarilyticus TaxID=260552 RepID=UPI001C952B93|nr:DUF3303 family protein [Microbulbifer agarilyticus]MBY6189134.1 hypothetical protein [Microbulbifer agarilyticus]
MRLLFRFTIPVEKGNECASDGTLMLALKVLVEETKPEAAYFHLDNGCRAGTLVFEADDAEKMAAINEPFFAKVNACIDIQPVLALDELLKSV